MKTPLKIRRVIAFTCARSRVEFVPAIPGFKVLWQKASSPVLAGTFSHWRKVGWIDDPRPTPALARFFIRKACAEDEGKTTYFYADQNIDPPETYAPLQE
ncbi:MAG: hypothetical protein C5B50_01020 [Verrucomicrobia bacterium]|nr:MAG: hypothetical protein C5B50_01020 [Verrucomicrobiota bacterium]